MVSHRCDRRCWPFRDEDDRSGGARYAPICRVVDHIKIEIAVLIEVDPAGRKAHGRRPSDAGLGCDVGEALGRRLR